MATKYKFDTFDSAPVPSKKKHHRRQTSNNSENNEDNDPTDGNGSLTYSAASSINSAAGESTDSSLAGIMKVLDVQDSRELAAVLEKERIRKPVKGDKSVASQQSWIDTYSVDTESHLKSVAPSVTTEQSGLVGTKIGTIAGQSSDQGGYDGGNYGGGAAGPPGGNKDSTYHSAEDGGTDFLFAPAEHEDSLKRRKDKKRRERKQADNQTPKVKNSKKPATSSNSSITEEAPPRVNQVTPPQNMNHPSATPSSRPPKGRGGENMEMAEEEDVWYAKWWMFCFPDTVKTMTPKR